jgi:FAD/FMN-containing dehydrogenase
MINESALTLFKSTFRGDIVLPGDKSYDESRKVYNGMIDRHPALIAYCTDTVDVINVVNFARDNNIIMSIRGGGHNAGGLGVWDDSVVADLSKIRYCYVDPDAKTVRVGGGCKWGDVDHATNYFGYAVPSGIISTTGVGGLTLGGGVGHLTRKYGLAIDNLIEVDIVLADGKLVKASETVNKNLFWALRGGGGNFGVVTSFLFKLNKLKNVYAGPMLWEMDKATEILKWYSNYIKTAPEDVNGFFAFLVVPPGDPFPKELHLKKMCGIVWCYTGPEDKAAEIFDPIRKLKPTFEFMGNMPHTMLQSFFDPLFPPGLQWYWKADFVKDLSDDAIKLHVKNGNLLPSMLSTTHLYPVNGAASKPKNKDTAWNYRDAIWAWVVVGVDPDPANKDKITKWAKDYYNDLHPFGAGGAYVNFMMHDEGENRVKATYSDNFDRLVKVKKQYDPKNLFRVNQNINPSS